MPVRAHPSGITPHPHQGQDRSRAFHIGANSAAEGLRPRLSRQDVRVNAADYGGVHGARARSQRQQHSRACPPQQAHVNVAPFPPSRVAPPPALSQGLIRLPLPPAPTPSSPCMSSLTQRHWVTLADVETTMGKAKGLYQDQLTFDDIFGADPHPPSYTKNKLLQLYSIVFFHKKPPLPAHDKQLGKGGLSTVYRVSPTSGAPSRMALKQTPLGPLHPEQCRGRYLEGTLAFMEIEAYRQITQVNQPHRQLHYVLDVHRFRVVHGSVWVLMEEAQGGDIEPLCGRMSLPSLQFIIACIGSTVYLLPKLANVCHHDVKPQQMALRACGRPALFDFNVATQYTNITSRAGSTGYTAPEVLDPRKPSHDCRCDLYSLGASACVMARPEDRQRVAPLRELVTKLISEDPASRPSYDEFKAHPFFSGVNWDAIEDGSALPTPELQQHAAAMAANN